MNMETNFVDIVTWLLWPAIFACKLMFPKSHIISSNIFVSLLRLKKKNLIDLELKL